MRQSIGTIWITTLVITFMLIFVGYLTFMISFSDTERTKNDILSIIEKRNGFTTQSPNEISYKGKNLLVDYGTLQTINLYLKGRGYKEKGICSIPSDETWYGVSDLKVEGNGKVSYDKVDRNSSKTYYYCFTKKNMDSKRVTAYYKIIVFYQFDLPIISAMEIGVEGKTNLVTIPSYCEIQPFRTNIDFCPKERKDGKKSQYERVLDK